MAEDNIIAEESNEQKRSSKVEKIVNWICDIPNKDGFKVVKGIVIGAGATIGLQKLYRIACEQLAGSDDLEEELADAEGTSEDGSEEELPF